MKKIISLLTVFLLAILSNSSLAHAQTLISTGDNVQATTSTSKPTALGITIIPDRNLPATQGVTVIPDSITINVNDEPSLSPASSTPNLAAYGTAGWIWNKKLSMYGYLLVGAHYYYNYSNGQYEFDGEYDAYSTDPYMELKYVVPLTKSVTAKFFDSYHIIEASVSVYTDYLTK